MADSSQEGPSDGSAPVTEVVCTPQDIATMIARREDSDIATMIARREDSDIVTLIARREDSDIATLIARREDSDISTLIARREDSPVPSSSQVTDGMTTPPRHAQSPSYSPTARGRSRLGTRSRQRLGRVRSFPTSQLGAMAVRDESFCDCPQQSQTRDLACKCGEEDSWFEWVWERETKSAASELTDDSREAKFHVNYSSGTAAVRGSQPMTDRQHFWEMKMTTPVYGTDIMVGVGTGTVDLNAFRYNFCSLLGKDAESWGYSYFGRTQHKGDFTYIENSRYGQGSIIGVHLDMWHGSVSFYKNRRPLGTVYTGLGSKTLYPMVSSTAARTGMRLTKSCSFSTSLQFLCCQVLRKIVPSHLDVTEALELPPGLHAFLTNNLSWLLRPSELESDRVQGGASGSSRKRAREVAAAEYDSDSEPDVDADVMLSKRARRSSSELSISEEESIEEFDISQQQITEES